MKEPTLLHTMFKPVHSIRLELQGLRAIAILSVMAFHLWGRSCRNGYFGVDMFFVISGYLMCMLMFRQTKFNTNTITDFYFRRLKRILPTYLLIMIAVLLLVIRLGSPFDYPYILREIAPAAFYYSNNPSTHLLPYFDEIGLEICPILAFVVVGHGSSELILTELQFYLIFPLFFVCILALNNIHSYLKFLFILSVIFYSFISQTFAGASDAGHMLLNNRLWQFFLGFLAHFAHESEWMRTNLNSEIKLLNYQTNLNISAFLLNVCLIPLVFLLCFKVIVFHQLERLLVSLLTSFIITANFQQGYYVLKNPLLVELGNISFSVYLIHWPLFVAHRMLFVNSYTLNKNPTFLVGLMLAALAVTLGYATEKSVAYVFKYVRTWLLLILFILTAYLCLGATTYYLVRHSPKTFDSDLKSERANYNEIVQIWENRHNYTSLTPNEAYDLNQKMTTFVPTRGYVLSLCSNQTKQLPSNYTIDPRLIHSACHERGNGNKTMVVFGNSHATFSHAGIMHLFRDVYYDLTTVFQFSCVPLPEDQQQMRLQKSGRRDCAILMDEIVKVLRGWHKPIDILVILFGYNGMDDANINENLKARDEGFLFMKNFYGQINEVAREVLFLPSLNMYFSFLPTRLIQTRLLEGKIVTDIGDSRRKAETFMPILRKHLEMLKCERCIRVNWSNLWCEPGENGLCRPADENGLLYFVDSHHTSLYGAMFVGEFLRNLYADYLEQNAIN